MRAAPYVVLPGFCFSMEGLVGPQTAASLCWMLLMLGLAEAGLLDFAKNNRIEVNVPWLPSSTESRCYDELGCLNLTKDWYHIIYRPFNVFPLPRQTIDTKFILYTRLNPTEGQILRATDDQSIEKSNFDASKPTKFIIHGFIDTPLSSWVKEKYNLNPTDVHLIGHSLGAHTAGYAGENVQGLGRITGLDPAEPYFQGMPSSVRLDPGDAKLVDVIHTDGTSIFLLGYGMVEPCGHLDFYPNNGKEQPGCDISENPLPLTVIREGIEEASRVLLACSHVRAVKFFIESINSPCPYLAHRCPSYQHFLQGKCFSCGPNGTNCALMGLHTTRGLLPPGAKFFVQTGKEPPYCRRHYRVTVELARPAKAETWVQGFMRISLHSDQGKIRDLDLTPNGYEKLEHGTSRSFVVSHPEEIGPVSRVEVYWEYDMNVLQPRSICFLWCNDHLYISSVRVSASKILNSREKRAVDVVSKLCSPGHRGYADIASRSTALFLDNCRSD